MMFEGNDKLEVEFNSFLALIDEVTSSLDSGTVDERLALQRIRDAYQKLKEAKRKKLRKDNKTVMNLCADKLKEGLEAFDKNTKRRFGK